MSHRLQVLLDEREFRRIRQLANKEGTTVAEWVRRRLRPAPQNEAPGAAAAKLTAIRTAACHAFPVAEVDEMNEEIARGAAAGLP